jgi:hypothetical protein
LDLSSVSVGPIILERRSSEIAISQPPEEMAKMIVVREFREL